MSRAEELEVAARKAVAAWLAWLATDDLLAAMRLLETVLKTEGK